MAAVLLLALFGASRVLAQDDHCVPGFKYLGCSNIDLSCFENPIDFADGRITPEVCQDACKGHHYAALLPDACRCGDDVDSIRAAKEDICDFSCMNIPALGTCGSTAHEDGFGTANVYESSELFHQEPLPPALESESIISLPAAKDAAWYPSFKTPCTTEAVPTLFTPVVPAPEPATFSTTCLEKVVETGVLSTRTNELLTTSFTEPEVLVTEKPSAVPETSLVIKNQFSVSYSEAFIPPTYSQQLSIPAQQACPEYGPCTPTLGAVVLEPPKTIVPVGPQTSVPIVEVSPPSQVPENASARGSIIDVVVAWTVALIAVMMV
ncbi:hypothetical protein HIM_05690 [Hirsutella minnesotensis 3608]|uniref:WSC domain-containing protein n=1 Tax=Hirsutella minnesotensis 3608 TaxID=1043627 RepID=A0A0F8A599_9HYPO|nr:hypothetical protein HIM_05690 [Hirsutella minnesotensis 3608]